MTMYVAALKARPAEFTTLAGLRGDQVLPLLEFSEHENRGVGSELLYAFEQLTTHWAGEFLMDLRLLAVDPADRALAWQLASFWFSKHPALTGGPSVDLFEDAAVLAGGVRQSGVPVAR